MKKLTDKYKNWKDDYFVTQSSHESTMDVSRYIKEVWSFDGISSFKKTTEDTSPSGSSVKIPPVLFTPEEFLAYTDMLLKLRAMIFDTKPKAST